MRDEEFERRMRAMRRSVERSNRQQDRVERGLAFIMKTTLQAVLTFAVCAALIVVALGIAVGLHTVIEWALGVF